jgi:hypothetical protein
MVIDGDTNLLLASSNSDIGSIVNLSKRIWFSKTNQPERENTTTESKAGSEKKNNLIRNIFYVSRSGNRSGVKENDPDLQTGQKKGLGGIIGFFFSLLGMILFGFGILGVIISISDFFTSAKHLGGADGWTYAALLLGLFDIIGWAVLLTFLFISGFTTAGLILVIIEGVLALAAVIAYLIISNQ